MMLPMAPPAWVWPLASTEILSRFTAPAHAYGPGHRGLDLAASLDAEVRAVADGVVAFVGVVAGVPVVSVDHGAIRSTYQPVAATLAVGDRVRAGTPLGTVTAGSGHCPRPCLHVGARVADDYLDPLRLLTPQRAVLKPLGRVGVRHADAPG